MKKTQKEMELKEELLQNKKVQNLVKLLCQILLETKELLYGSGGDSVSGSLGFNFEMPDLFGSNRKGVGNDFVGYFYDLKQTKKGELSEIGNYYQWLSQVIGKIII